MWSVSVRRHCYPVGMYADSAGNDVCDLLHDHTPTISGAVSCSVTDHVERPPKACPP